MIAAQASGSIVGIDLLQNQIYFTAQLVFENQTLAIADFLMLDDARALVADTNGCVYAVVLPNKLADTFQLTGKCLGRCSRALVVSNSENTPLKQIQLFVDSEVNTLVCCGIGAGASVQIFNLDNVMAQSKLLNNAKVMYRSIEQ